MAVYSKVGGGLHYQSIDTYVVLFNCSIVVQSVCVYIIISLTSLLFMDI